jgi:hypothetical protein
MPLARPTFLRVHVPNGSQSTICAWCLRSIATDPSEDALKAVELRHECDHTDLQRFAPVAKRRSSGPSTFQAWVAAKG